MITADQTVSLRREIQKVKCWQKDPADPKVEYGEFTYKPVGWKKEHWYLVWGERGEEKYGHKALFEKFSYYAVVTNCEGEVQILMKTPGSKGASERRIGQFTNEFLSHLPLEGFMAKWFYLLCAQLDYNLSLWIRDLVLPKGYRI